MDNVSIGDMNNEEFPAVTDFIEEENRNYTKAIPFRDLQTQKVYKVNKFVTIKIGARQEVILELVDAEKNQVNCWATSLIKAKYQEKSGEWCGKNVYIISNGKKKSKNPLRDYYLDFKIIYK